MNADQDHLSLPRGIHDAGPERTALHRRLEQNWYQACALAGFRAVELPPLGYEATFTVGHHAAGERIYKFRDRNGRALALTPDSLPAAFRAALDIDAAEQRLSYRCPVFRYEHRPRRFFHHLGLMEVRRRPVGYAAQVGSTRRMALLAYEFVAPAAAVTVSIADPGLWRSLFEEHASGNDVAARVDGLRRVDSCTWARALHDDGAPERLVRQVEALVEGRAGDQVDGEDYARRLRGCESIADALREQGAKVEIDLCDLHASEFHDGPAFRLNLDGRRPLGDGGSYGAFATGFAGTPTSLFAAVVGLERLADVVASGGAAPAAPAADVAVVAMPDDASLRQADELAVALRRSGIAVWDTEWDKRGARQRRLLDDMGIRWTVFVGPRDLAAQQHAVRDSDGIVHRLPPDEVLRWILKRSGGPAGEPSL